MAARNLAGREVGQCFLFEDFLPERLRSLGLTDVDRILMHNNRTVMLSLSRRVLRIHRGYGFAPDSVLLAIVRFLSPRVPRVLRREAEREFLRFPVTAYAPTPPRPYRRERSQPGDSALLRRLQELHSELNIRHFGGRLSSIRIRLSGRMSTRLGELVLEPNANNPREIGISRRHATRHPWSEVEHTMLHEMVHQWQAESGLPVNHGPTFRAKARAVGALPAARRPIRAGLPGFN